MLYKIKTLKGDIILILVAIIWGSTFTVQKLAMENLDPLYFTGMRFLLGGLFLIPILFMSGFIKDSKERKKTKSSFVYGLLGGIIISIAAALQQIGLVYTTPTKAGFLTSFYIIFTPMLALFMEKKPRKEIWITVALALSGLYLLTIQKSQSLRIGDSLQLLGALFWAFHIIVISLSVKKVNVLLFSITQFLITAFINFILGFIAGEIINVFLIYDNFFEIIYAGLISVGIGYTLQVVGQKITPPSHTAIILSLEAIAAAIFSIVFFGEKLVFSQYIGCFLIFLGVLLCELLQVKKIKTK